MTDDEEPVVEYVAHCLMCDLAVSSPGTRHGREYFERFAEVHAENCHRLNQPGGPDVVEVAVRSVEDPVGGLRVADQDGEELSRHATPEAAPNGGMVA